MTTRFERYLATEIGIEFKACLYFYCILVFYSVFRILNGSLEASILHMAEMILTTYLMGDLQVYLLSNFDEGEQFSGRSFGYSVLCSLLYTVVAWICGWYGKSGLVLGLFFAFMLLSYVCVFLIYKLKRDIDTRKLNEDLKAFQERKQQTFQKGENHGECD